MNRDVKRYLIPATGTDNVAMLLAFSHMEKVCNDLGGNKDVILLLPTKRQVKGTTVETALGTNIVKDLEKNKPVRLQSGGKLKLESERTFKGLRGADIILGVYVTKKMLDMINDTDDAKAVIVVPWDMAAKEVNEWVETWNPTIIGEMQEEPPKNNIIKNPVVEEALKALTMRINLSTGLSHPSDKYAAIKLFRLLLANGETYDPDSMRMWAVKNSWKSEDADELREYAKGVLQGKKYRVPSTPYWVDDIIEKFRDAAHE